MASRGARKLGEDEEQIEDNDELIQVRKQARRVIIKVFFAALVMTLIVYFLPF